MLNEIYFKPDEDIISSIYVLKSDIPSVQLMNVVTVRIPVKIRFDSEKLLLFPTRVLFPNQLSELILEHFC
jgi:hypothetical protein